MSSPSSDSYDSHARKRVGKACDRCRLKKSKCDGANPCSRCKIDNAICVFGERKKSHDRVYPKGYVEMLEHQQSQIVAGLRQTYRILLEHGQWPGSALKEYDGNPLTHDILERLGILHLNGESPDSPQFEDDLEKLQDRMIAENGVSASRHRRHSPPSDEEPELEQSSSPHDSPATRNSSLSTSYSRKRSPSTPPQEEPFELRPSPKQLKFESMVARKQPVFDYTQAMVQTPYVVDSPNLDLSGMDLNFGDEAVSMYDPLFSNTYFAPAITNMPTNNAGFGLGFDADFDVFQHSGLHNGAAY